MRVVIPVVAAGLVPLFLAPVHAAGQGTRVLDRTYMCSTTAKAGVRKVEVDARRGFREAGKWRWFSSAGIENWGGPPVRLPPNSAGFVATTDLNWSFGFATGIGSANPDPAVFRAFPASVSLTPRRACVSTRSTVSFSTRGLDGGPADYFGDEYACVVPAKVLVRVRAVFTVPARLRTDPSQGALRTQRASGDVREGQLVVRTTSGRALAFASTSAAGSARLLTARSCTPK
jgi:hypothetical protein